MLEIKEVDWCESWINRALEQKRKIAGFGHRVYKKGDSRSPIIEEVRRRLSETTGNPRWFTLSKIIERIMKEKKNLFPNLDFYSATSYYQMNLPVSLYTSLFVASRISGWGAHIMEQHDQNKLIRPHSLYEGPAQLNYILLERR
ncbi:MAG: citrate/2-methylcitrate synthase [Nitrospiria bacterium]